MWSPQYVRSPLLCRLWSIKIQKKKLILAFSLGPANSLTFSTCSLIMRHNLPLDDLLVMETLWPIHFTASTTSYDTQAAPYQRKHVHREEFWVTDNKMKEYVTINHKFHKHDICMSMEQQAKRNNGSLTFKGEYFTLNGIVLWELEEHMYK